MYRISESIFFCFVFKHRDSTFIIAHVNEKDIFAHHLIGAHGIAYINIQFAIAV